MKAATRWAALGGITILAVALSGCVIRPYRGWGGGHHHHYGERSQGDPRSDSRDRDRGRGDRSWDDGRRGR